jgi:large subunit ribosomal protein L9
MQVILKETLDNLGEAGSIVNVKDGYARNFLFPRSLAAPATAGMRRQLDHIRRLAEKKRMVELKTAEDMKKRLEMAEVEVQARAGEKDKLYGSVTSANIADALQALGIKIDRRKIVMEHAIRELGPHTVKIKVDPKVTAQLKVTVLGSRDAAHESAFPIGPQAAAQEEPSANSDEAASE